MALHKLGRLEEALQTFEYARYLQPQFADTWLKIAVILHELGQEEKAQATIEQLLRGSPIDTTDAYHTGLIFHMLGRYQEAIERFDAALAVEPYFKDAQQAKARSLEAIKQSS